MRNRISHVFEGRRITGPAYPCWHPAPLSEAEQRVLVTVRLCPGGMNAHLFPVYKVGQLEKVAAIRSLIQRGLLEYTDWDRYEVKVSEAGKAYLRG